MGDELHKLYLFEFLVHSVTYKNSTLKLDPNFLKNLGPTCVQFKGKHLPSFIISEVDFCSKDNFNTNTVKFKSGKSSLFSLGNICFDDCRLNCEVTLKRKLPEGEDSSFYCMGKNTFCLNQKFINVLNSLGTEAVSQCLKLSLDMKNQMNETVATVRMLLRLTCFGTVIVTEFQKKIDDSKSFLFKGDRIVPAEEESCETVKAANAIAQDPGPFNNFPPMMPPPLIQQFPPPQMFPNSQPQQQTFQPRFPQQQAFNQPMFGPQPMQMMPPMMQPGFGSQQPIMQVPSRQQCYPVSGYF